MWSQLIDRISRLNDTSLSFIVTMLTVLVGAYVTVKKIGNQTKVQVLSNNRQAWINCLRTLLAEFLSLIEKLNHYQGQHGYDVTLKSTKSEDAIRTINQLDNLSNELILAKYKILLHLNPNEKDSENLISSLDEAYNEILKAKSIPKENLEPLLKKIIESGQVILKSEWERVKKLE